jgi:hypothetical protein
MSDNGNFGFAKLVPGFDFLQNLTKGGAQSMPQMPNLSSWVAPTLNVEELEKRIGELKAVHFWLDQNGKALGATIQALEVQKMTLATLQGMNFKMGDLASALQAKTPGAAPKAKPSTGDSTEGGKGKAAAAPAVDPLQWWGALTQQFQEIAGNAMKDVAQKSGVNAEPAAAAPARAPAAATKKAAARKSTPRKGRTST